MYTVMRFNLGGSRTTLDEFGAKLRELSNLPFEGPDRGVPNRVSVTVATDDTSERHLASIDSFVERHHAIIEWASQVRVRIGIDIAIEPEDFSGLLGSFTFTDRFLMQVGKKRIELTIPVYR